jgi:hypothetical protein
MIAAAVGVIESATQGTPHLQLVYDKAGGSSAVIVPSRFSLGGDYSEAVARLNVESIEVGDKRIPLWEVLDKEMYVLLNEYKTSEERKALQAKVVAQIETLMRRDESSRQQLEDAATVALRRLETIWQSV